jgi:hypothetical protein
MVVSARTRSILEVDQVEHEMSDCQLRMRIRAWEREQAWAPWHVGNELAGTHQAAARQHQTAALRRAEAMAADDPAERARLEQDAAEAAALAAVLEARAAELQQLDGARTVFS